MESKTLKELSMDELLELKSIVDEKIMCSLTHAGDYEELEIIKDGYYKKLFEKVINGIYSFNINDNKENKIEFWSDFDRLIKLAEFKGYELHAKQLDKEFEFLEEITNEIDEREKNND